MELMQQTKVKAEIQSLAAIAPDYLTSIYLPNKLRYGGWVWAQCCHSVDLLVNCWSCCKTWERSSMQPSCLTLLDGFKYQAGLVCYVCIFISEYVCFMFSNCVSEMSHATIKTVSSNRQVRACFCLLVGIHYCKFIKHTMLICLIYRVNYSAIFWHCCALFTTAEHHHNACWFKGYKRANEDDGLMVWNWSIWGCTVINVLLAAFLYILVQWQKGAISLMNPPAF